MVNCKDCGKELSEDQVTDCSMCGDSLCKECSINGLCSLCLEHWEAEIDLQDNYYEDLEDNN